ncbi:hypothetical protein C8F04DRAFT_1080921 [Mycena alexandri]|uniref:Uncharacterized protein n=1 Tax=Mycena alexandri TaxID=1745969 RepID=A0AAD6XA17_9AGAR|nr:hypothetical protein C8F04DRAFT_1080921 [Mycena alexandri]
MFLLVSTGSTGRVKRGLKRGQALSLQHHISLHRARNVDRAPRAEFSTRARFTSPARTPGSPRLSSLHHPPPFDVRRICAAGTQRLEGGVGVGRREWERQDSAWDGASAFKIAHPIAAVGHCTLPHMPPPPSAPPCTPPLRSEHPPRPYVGHPAPRL